MEAVPLDTHVAFSSLDEVRKELGKLSSPEYTYDRFQSFQDWCLDREDLLKSWISKLTMADLKKIVMVQSGDKKERVVKSFYQGIIGSFNLEGLVSYSPFDGETYKDALMKRLKAQTPEIYEIWRNEKQAKKAALQKSLSNPETLEEFQTYIRYRGEKSMTSEQKAAYDNLMADKIKERRQVDEERQAVVTKVDTGDVGMEIKKSWHAKKEIDIWVVQLAGRVERPVYEELNSKAKKLGGYYSSYRGNGAIPGFVFESEQAATLFTQVNKQDVDTSELKEEIKEERVQSRAEILRAKGEKLIQDGEEELGRERLANTARRARFAASAEDKAASTIRFGKMLVSIADGLEQGTIKYLEKISNKAELEQLNDMISVAKHKMALAKSKANGTRYEEEMVELSPELAEYVSYPIPSIWKDNVISQVQKMLTVNGKKLAAARMLKRLNALKEGALDITEGQRMEDFKTLFIDSKEGVDSWAVDRYKEQFADFNRMKRMKLDTIYELRAAIRELIQIRSGAKLTDEQKKEMKLRELERSFVGKKIDGFFPTPRPLVIDMLQKANIQPGETILEPSAGLGHIADVISELHPDNTLLIGEQYQPLCDALELKGYKVRRDDFFNVSQFGADPDKIVMNPPFENNQDIDHVMHAWHLLKTGGRLVAIVAGNKREDSNSQKIRDFVAFVNEHGYMEQNPAGSFESAFRPTGVNTITVVLDK